jgi:hypothetical protein
VAIRPPSAADSWLIAEAIVAASVATLPVSVNEAVVKAVPVAANVGVMVSVPVSPFVAPVPTAAPATLYNEPRLSALALSTEDTVIVLPVFGPTWKVEPWKVPSSRFTPLNEVGRRC